LAGWFTKKDEHTMSSAFFSPICERPIDPEEADEELNADQVHKEWKEYYERWKKEMEREHKVAVRHLEKSREESAKVRDRLITSESCDLVANALRDASNPERFDEQTYNMMVDIGKNVVYCRHKFVGGLNMNDYGTQNSPGDLALTKAKVTDERKGPFLVVYKEAVEFGVNYARNTSCTQIGRALRSK
jgi:hypothetical protein